MTGPLRSLVGRRCTRVTIDLYDPPLVFWFLYGDGERPDARLEVSGSFDLAWDRNVLRIDPERDRDAMGPVLQVVGRSVVAANVLDGGTLRAEFTGGVILVIADLADDERWWLATDDAAESSDIG